MTSIDCSSAEDVDRLYQRVGRLALSKVMKLVGNLSIAQEIVQEVFLHLWERGPLFGSEGAAYQWIYHSCHNGAIDHLRRHSTRLAHGPATPELEDTAAVDPGGACLARNLLGQLLAHLSRREAEAYVYIEVEGMTQNEAADMMGVSRKTIGRLLQTAEASLAVARERLRGEG